jgi:predicted RNase H-like nuclease (RuvC/YqgF family)
MTALVRFAALATLLGLAALSAPAQDQSNGDDVAAAARRSREQQKNAPKPAKVVTNDDFPSSSAPTPAPASDPKAKTEGKQEADQPSAELAAENDPKSETYWRKRFKKLHDKLAQSEKELDVLQRELDKNQVQYYSDPQKALMQQHDRSDVNEGTAKIDAKKKEIESLRQQLSDLEDQLRKAGGDPGWAR